MVRSPFEQIRSLALNAQVRRSISLLTCLENLHYHERTFIALRPEGYRFGRKKTSLH